MELIPAHKADYGIKTANQMARAALDDSTEADETSIALNGALDLISAGIQSLVIGNQTDH